MTNVIDPAISRKLRIHSRALPAERPIGGWRPHWVDHLHEPEGGEDRVGCHRVGIEQLQNHMDALYSRNGNPEAWDDMNEVFLDPEAVRLARKEEMDFFNKLGVYKRVPRSRVTEVGGKMVSVKWLDTNKGDKLNPNHRSRLVAR